MNLEKAKAILANRNVTYSSVYTFEREDGLGDCFSFNDGDMRVALAWKDSRLDTSDAMTIYHTPICDNTERTRRSYIEGEPIGREFMRRLDAGPDEPTLPTTPYWDFTAWVRVWDPKQLVEAARAHPDAADMVTEDFYLADGEVDIQACLVMLLDPGSLPGCSIEDSNATAAEAS